MSVTVRFGRSIFCIVLQVLDKETLFCDRYRYTVPVIQPRISAGNDH